MIDQSPPGSPRRELIGAQATRTVPARLATTLLRLAAKLGREQAQGVLLEVPLSRPDLAGLARSTPNRLARAEQMEGGGLIDSGGAGSRCWTGRAWADRREQEI